MKSPHLFSEHDVYHALNERIHGSTPVYRVIRQRGAGFGTVIRLFTRYAIPLIQRYIIPNAKQSLVSTVSDVIEGGSIKSSLKKNSKVFMKNVATDIVRSVQKGGKRPLKRVSKSGVLYLL